MTSSLHLPPVIVIVVVTTILVCNIGRGSAFSLESGRTTRGNSWTTTTTTTILPRRRRQERFAAELSSSPSSRLALLASARREETSDTHLPASSFSSSSSATSSSKSTKLSAAASAKDVDVLETLDLTPLAFGAAPEALLDVELFDAGDAVAVIDSSHQQQSSSLSSSIQLPLHELALAGSLTTMISDIIMHPIDCVKTLQQSDVGLGYSFVEAGQYLFDSDGMGGFYHGFLTYAIADSLGGALKFAVWEFWKQQSAHVWNKDGKIPTWMVLFVGAGLAFVASSIFIVPGELIKQQLQMSHYDGLFEAIEGIHSAQGLSGFFTGYEGVLYRDIPYTMLELGLYELFKSFLDLFKQQQQQIDSKEENKNIQQQQGQNQQEPWEQILAAAVTGGITAFLTTPIDVVKTKLMVDAEYLDDSFLECLLATVQNHGVSSVFAGVFARIAWILPFTAIYLPTYDYLKLLLWKRYHLQQQQQELPSSK